MRLADLQGKRVGIWGFGREGRAALAALAQRGVEPEHVVVHSDDPLDAADESATVDFISGPAGVTALAQCDVVIRSPGVSIYNDDLQRLKSGGLAVTTGTNLWLAELPEDVTTVAVTATKGKSTTASLIAHLARAGGADAELSGNIGVPLLARPLPAGGALAVLELSSFQIADLAQRVSLGVLLNVYREHLDWHLTAENYRRDKLRLASTELSEAVVLNALQPELAELAAGRDGVTTFGGSDGFHLTGDQIAGPGGAPLIAFADLTLPGEHNALNVCAALAACDALGLGLENAAAELSSFEPLPHRLETIATADGRTWVNDSISTTPESAVAALESFPGRPITLIVGGFERDQEFDALCMRVAASPEPIRVIGLPDTGQRIVQQIGGGAMGIGHVSLYDAESLEAAVELATEVTPAAGVVLLSPAAPSFGQFRDFEERGARFSELAQRAAAG